MSGRAAGVLLGVVAALLATACREPSVHEQAKTLGTRPFTQQAWAVAGQEQRGEMVYSLLATQPVTKVTASHLKGLLGEPTGYYDHESNPAYVVGPKTVKSPYAKGYLLVFEAHRLTGHIEAVRLVPPPPVD